MAAPRDDEILRLEGPPEPAAQHVAEGIIDGQSVGRVLRLLSFHRNNWSREGESAIHITRDRFRQAPVKCIMAFQCQASQVAGSTTGARVAPPLLPLEVLQILAAIRLLNNIRDLVGAAPFAPDRKP